LLDAALEGLQQVFSPHTFLFLLVGVAVGMMTGLLPGLGGAVGMALLLPFIYGMEPASAIAMLVGIMAVNNTSDTFTAILLGVPGSSSSQATIMDGYPLARRGEGARALGAALSGSMVGGVIGAAALVALIPIAKPMILALESPELLMLMLIGVATVGVLSGSKPLAGLLTACLGLLLGAVGPAPAGPARFILFDWTYLRQGISVVLVVMGLYAIPELINLLKERSPVARGSQLAPRGLLHGIRDVWQNKILVLFASIYAICAGVIPGLSGAAVSWTAYAGAKGLCRNTQGFGKGDIRGVIAPDTCNNAMEGGQLVPIMMFGIPGSASGAILLGGLFLVGVQPGQDMVVGDGLVLLLVTAFSVALANVFATSICLGGAPWIARISQVQPGMLVPAIFLTVIFAAFQVSTQWDDIYMLLIIATVGLVLYSRGWPRAPMLIGFVLGAKIEGTLRISLDRYELSWLRDPRIWVLAAIFFLVIIGGVVVSAREIRSSRKPSDEAEELDDALHTPQVAAESPLREASVFYWIAWFLGLVGLIAVAGMAIGAAVWLAAFLRIEVHRGVKTIAIYLVGYAVVLAAIYYFIAAELPTSLIFR
jgi:putative tricarboxylic transport membrane protein